MADDGAGRLTTHVLDTSLGRPAEGLAVTLHRLGDAGSVQVAAAVTNADGRCEAPLLSAEAFLPGRYELCFAAGPYLARTAPSAAADVPFLDDVVIRFGISERAHYHVPLLLSPFGYSTYRGS